MEKHIILLEKLCRICGGKIILNRGYVNAKSCSEYSDILQKFGVSENESHEVGFFFC